MKRWKQIALLSLIVLLLTQIPFAVRRYNLWRLRQTLNALQRERQPTSDQLREVKGVMHVHTNLGGHSTGTFAELITAAHANDLDFVLMTEHPARDYDTSAHTLRGQAGRTLFVGGSEVVTEGGDRLLIAPGVPDANRAGAFSTEDFIRHERTRDGRTLAVVAYPQQFRGFANPTAITSADAVEVYNLYTDASANINRYTVFFDGLWNYPFDPELMFALFYTRPTENLRLWDAAMRGENRLLAATAGNDAHSNVGIHIGLDSGQKPLGIKLDPYERSFRLFRMHLLLMPDEVSDESTILRTIKRGRAFIGFDVFADTSGFRFNATNGIETKQMGEEIKLTNALQLKVSAPLAGCLVRLFKDGVSLREAQGEVQQTFAVTEPGIYRVEVYLQVAGLEDKPWIISNAIRVTR